ncbi:MAG: T9SS type A sorting domain-containing protein [Bacteroidia bacterium]|nr:T9SS type A sorting domain-containing protein [Bacteroidia bacterium]
MRSFLSYQYVLKLLGFFMVITPCLIQAQTLKYQKVYGGYSYDFGNDLLQSPDTGYLLLCTSSSFSPSADFYLLKTDKYGNFQWNKTYGGNGIEGARKLKYTQDGNIIMAGFSDSFEGRTYDFYLVKATSTGDTLWTKHYGTPEWDFAYGMDTCSDGGFIMVGKTYETNNMYSDILMVKTDADGNEQWQKKIGGLLDDVAYAVISVPGGYVMCGTTANGIYGGTDIYVVKTDLLGNVLWQTYYGDIYDDEGTGVYLASDNALVISGHKREQANPNNFNTNIRKLSLDGTNYWPMPYSSTGSIDFRINNIIEGYHRKITSIGSFDGNSPGIKDMVMFIWDTTAQYLNGGTFGGSFDDYGNNIIKTSDGGYAMIGSTQSYDYTHLSKIFFVKTDTILPSDAPVSVVIGIEPHQLSVKNNIYPNPAQDVLYIRLELPVDLVLNNHIQLNLYNQLGQALNADIHYSIKSINNSAMYQIQSSSLPNGLYFYEITAPGKTIDHGKFMISK